MSRREVEGEEEAKRGERKGGGRGNERGRRRWRRGGGGQEENRGGGEGKYELSNISHGKSHEIITCGLSKLRSS